MPAKRSGAQAANFTSIFVTAQDGVRLHARDYGPRAGARLPVICLPGLTRTCADFHALATALSSDSARPRRVLSVDYRGRGGSDYDDPRNYTIPVEMADVLAVAIACDALPSVFVGTSRGGLIIMALAAARPAAIAGIVLNDIGPVIEAPALLRIKGYVGRVPEMRTFEDGSEILRRAFGAQFPALGPADWMAWSHRAWKRDGDRLIPTYDVRLASVLEAVDGDSPMPPLWPQFDALPGVPLMLVRGAHSDLLSRETVKTMRARRPDMRVLEVPDQGHAPLLAEPETIEPIVEFVAGCERVCGSHI